MSVYATTWAWEQPTANPGQRLVLLAMADNASGPDSDEPGICWPSVELIAAKCGLSTRQVKRHLADLHEAGMVVKMERRRRRDGSFSVWEYLVPYQGTPTSPGDRTRGHPRSSPGDTHGMDQGTPTSPQEEPSCEPSVEPSSTEIVLDRFEELWAQFPKIRGTKAEALKRWGALSRTQREHVMRVLPDWLLYWQARGPAEAQFIPACASWLGTDRTKHPYEGFIPPVAATTPKPNSPMGILQAIANRDNQ